MAGEKRNSDNSIRLFNSLINESPQWGFYAALRQLEALYDDKPRFGKSRRLYDDPIRLGQHPSVIFAPSTIQSSTYDEEGLLRLKVLFFGMFGPNGPLPLHLTEYARNRMRDAKDEAIIEFMDMFHHRLLSLFYRIWADKEPTAQYDRPETDRFHWYVGSLFGIGSEELHHRDDMPDNSKLHFAAHLGSLPHHAEGLVSILRSFFRIPLSIKEFIGEWLPIPVADHCHLGSQGNLLGSNTVVGSRSWQRQYRFRLCIGPMQLNEYEQLLPNQERLGLVKSIVKNYLGYEFACEANLILRQKEVPTVRLGSYGQLGWTTWLNNKQSQKDADDLLLAIRL